MGRGPLTQIKMDASWVEDGESQKFHKRPGEIPQYVEGPTKYRPKSGVPITFRYLLILRPGIPCGRLRQSARIFMLLRGSLPTVQPLPRSGT